MDCSTFTCRRRPPKKIGKAVWTVDGKRFCNICFLNWLDKNEVAKQKIVRLFDDEMLYDDPRRKKRIPRAEAHIAPMTI